MNPRFVTQKLLSAMQLLSDETEKLSVLIIKMAVSAAMLFHALKIAARILTDR